MCEMWAVPVELTPVASACWIVPGTHLNANDSKTLFEDLHECQDPVTVTAAQASATSVYTTSRQGTILDCACHYIQYRQGPMVQERTSRYC